MELSVSRVDTRELWPIAFIINKVAHRIYIAFGSVYINPTVWLIDLENLNVGNIKICLITK